MIIRLFKMKVVLLIIILLLILLPAISFAQADKIFKDNNKAVVVIITFDKGGEPLAQGSGFIIRDNGAVVTNYHVISNASDIKVKAGDKILDIEGLIYTDIENDIVILKVNGANLPTVKLGDIKKTNIGEKVYVISSPEGLENTISDGILSGIREITPDKKVLQITAPISSGSSGGPVFNKDGEVVGIATFIIQESQNLNFAMPVNLLKGKIDRKKVTALKESKIEDYEKTAEYWFYLGYYYGEAGMYKEAMEAYKQAIRIKPDFAEAHYSLGLAYGNLGMHVEAIDAFKKSIRIKPDYALAHYNLGVGYEKLGVYKEAIEAFKQVIRIKPDFAEAHNNLGSVYDDLGMYREAVESYKQAIRINPNNNAHYNLGITYTKLEMYREAVGSFKQSIRIDPIDATSHYNLGNSYIGLGIHKKAVEAYKQAIRINPDYLEAHGNLSAAYKELGMYTEALEVAKQTVSIKPDSALAHYNLGLIYLNIGDRGSALNEYKTLKELHPELANKLFNEIYE